MDAKNGSHSICEAVNTISSIELIKSPVKTHRDHDCVARHNLDLTIRSNVELQDVLDTDVAVLTTSLSLSQLSMAAK